MPSIYQLRKRYKASQSPKKPIEMIGVLGDRAGVVGTSSRNIVNVTLANGQTMQVENTRVPFILGLRVAVGYHESKPNQLQVLRQLNAYDKITGWIENLVSHAWTHEWPSYDTAYIRSEQFMPLLCAPAGGFVVRIIVNSIVRWSDGTYLDVPSQDFDISSFVPTTGALYVLVYIKSDGTLDAIAGDVNDTVEALSAEDIPAEPSDGVGIFAVRLYSGQTALRKDSNVNDFVDLRFARLSDAYDLATDIHDATDKTTPEDGDEFGIWDSAVSTLKKLSWLTIRTALNVFFRERLSANRTYYVRTDGNDSNNGLANTAGGAFLTIQKAIDTVAGLDIDIYDVTIQVGDGTYTEAIAVNGAWVGSGDVTIQGNSGTPANVLISTTSTDAITVASSGRLTVKDLELRTTTSGFTMTAKTGGIIKYSNLRFGACASSHIRAIDNGAFECVGNYAITSGCAAHFGAFVGGVIRCTGVTITLSGTPAFSSAFAQCQTVSAMLVLSITFAGTGATGVRYAITSNGVIGTGGGGANYFPGDSAGTTATGGQYL